MQTSLPGNLFFAVVIDPVFLEHGQDVVIHNGFHPLVRAVGGSLAAAEIAVADAETPSQGEILRDLLVERLTSAISASKWGLFSLR